MSTRPDMRNVSSARLRKLRGHLFQHMSPSLHLQGHLFEHKSAFLPVQGHLFEHMSTFLHPLQTSLWLEFKAQGRCKDAPRTHRGGSMALQRRPEVIPSAPGTLHGRAKDAPRTPQGPPGPSKDASRTPQGRPGPSKDASSNPKGDAKTPQRHFRDAQGSTKAG